VTADTPLASDEVMLDRINAIRARHAAIWSNAFAVERPFHSISNFTRSLATCLAEKFDHVELFALRITEIRLYFSYYFRVDAFVGKADDSLLFYSLAVIPLDISRADPT